ncbi:MAG TPA: hypothetical protein VGP79_18805, partial [Bryobacteraceae bacterium]|nr:hypothetical protein [Bryobacteraceae bacterium]
NRVHRHQGHGGVEISPPSPIETEVMKIDQRSWRGLEPAASASAGVSGLLLRSWRGLQPAASASADVSGLLVTCFQAVLENSFIFDLSF